MKLKKVILHNFRGYSRMTEIPIDQLTALIGKNDVGKSTILDALDVFFNKNKMEIADRNVHCREDDVVIGCVFSDFPDEVLLDETVPTTLEREYLLNEEGFLEVRKHYSASGKERVYILANHPSNEPYDCLLQKKNTELKALIRSADIQQEVNLSINSEMRVALWNSLGESLTLSKREISADKEDAKNIWQKLVGYLPRYHVFRVEGPTTDDDAVAQDPMMIAVKEAIEERRDELTQIAEEIKSRVSQVANKTLDKLGEFDTTLASSLNPQFKKEPAWDKAFSFSLTRDEDIPLNKRGSGIRRMVLFSFFRAACEENLDGTSDMIYAVEEPETSQHPDFQKMIIQTFAQMTETPHCQIIITTHVPGLAKMIPVESLRYVTDGEGYPEVEPGSDGTIVRIAETLGVLPDINPPLQPTVRNIRLIVCVEGPTDIDFLKSITTVLHREKDEIKPVDDLTDVILIHLGGSTLQDWVNHNYLQKLRVPEYHIYDRDTTGAHQTQCNTVNERGDGSSARITSKREIENYIHKDAIEEEYGFTIDVTDDTDVPQTISNMMRTRGMGSCSESKVKKRLNQKAALRMTFDRLRERDPNNDILTWICEIEGIDFTNLLADVQ